MKIEDFHWETIDKVKLYGKYWAPDGNVKAVICLVHGMGEHVDRYGPLADFLVEAGYAVIGFDQRGHGKSEGKRGHTPSYNLLMSSVEELLAFASKYFPNKPKVLYGHSMGGNLVANYVIKKKPIIAGVILSSPWFKLAFDPPAIQVKLAKLVNNIFPTFTQSSKLDTTAISRIPEEVKKYENDPLVHDKISSMMFLSIHDQGLWALEHADEIHLPTLIFHGSADRLTSADATKEFAKKLNNGVTLKIFEGAYHEIHNDLDRFELFNLVKNWLDKTVKQ